MSVNEVADQVSLMEIAPGLWDFSSEVVEVRAPSLPREVRNHMVGPRRRLRHCITAAQARRPSTNFLLAGPGSGCTYRDFVVRGGRIAGTMICPDARTRMDGRYGPDAYDMRMEMEIPAPGGGVMKLNLRARGRRVGACPEGANQ